MPYITLPNGKSFELLPGESPEQALDAAKQKYPQLFADTSKAREGFIANLGAGARDLAGNYLVGISALGDENVARKAARAEEAAQLEGAKTTSWEDVKKAVSDQGVGGIGSAGAFLRDQIARSAPQMAATMGAASLGATAGTAVAGPAGTLIGGGIGALAANVPSFFGSNIKRQISEQDEAGREAPLEKGKAAGAAVAQGALDAASTLFLFGKMGVGALGGTAIKEVVKKPITAIEADLVKEASASIAKAAGKGIAEGIAIEMPTEVAQQVLERYQAGLPLLDADARKEYEASAAGAAGLGGIFGGAGGIRGRATAKTEAAKLASERDREATQAKNQLAAEEEKSRAAAPEYLLNLEQTYMDMRDRVKELSVAVKQKIDNDDYEASQKRVQDKAELIETRKRLSENIGPEYLKNKEAIARVKERLRVTGQSPEEAFMERLGIPTVAVTPPETPTSIEEAGMQSANMPPMSDAQKWVTDKVDAVQRYSFGAPVEPAEIAQSLMEMPAYAQAVQKGEVIIPGVDSKTRKEISTELKKQLQSYRADIDPALKEGLDAPTPGERMYKRYLERDAQEQRSARRDEQDAAAYRALDTAGEREIASRATPPMELASQEDIATFKSVKPETNKAAVSVERRGMFTPDGSEAESRQALVDKVSKIEPQLARLNAAMQRSAGLRPSTLVTESGELTAAGQRVKAIEAQRDTLAGELRNAKEKLTGSTTKEGDNLDSIVDTYLGKGLTREELGTEEQRLADTRNKLLKQLVENTDKARGIKDVETIGRKAETRAQRDALIRQIAENTVNQIQASRELNGLPPLEWNGAADLYKSVKSTLAERAMSRGDRAPGSGTGIPAIRVEEMQKRLRARLEKLETNVVEGRGAAVQASPKDVELIKSQLARLGKLSMVSEKERTLNRFLQDTIDRGALTGDKLQLTAKEGPKTVTRAEFSLGEKRQRTDQQKAQAEDIIQRKQAGEAAPVPRKLNKKEAVRKLREAELRELAAKIKNGNYEGGQNTRIRLLEALKDKQKSLLSEPGAEEYDRAIVRQYREQQLETVKNAIGSPRFDQATRVRIAEQLKAQEEALSEPPTPEEIATAKARIGEERRAMAPRLFDEQTKDLFEEAPKAAYARAEEARKDKELAQRRVERISKENRVEGRMTLSNKGQKALDYLDAAEDTRAKSAREVFAARKEAKRLATSERLTSYAAKKGRNIPGAVPEHAKVVRNPGMEASVRKAKEQKARDDSYLQQQKRLENEAKETTRVTKGGYSGAAYETAEANKEAALRILASKAKRAASAEEKFIEDLDPQTFEKLVQATKERVAKDLEARTGAPVSQDDANWAKYVQPRMYAAFKALERQGAIPTAEDLDWSKLARVMARQSEVSELHPHSRKAALRTGNKETAQAAREAANRARLRERIKRQKDTENRLFDTDENIMYRSAENAPTTAVNSDKAEALVRKFKAKLPEEVNFVYARTAGDIPVRLLNKMERQGKNPQTDMTKGAVFDDGTILVVGDMHSDLRDLEETLMHEIVGHYGVDTLLGADGIKDLTSKLQKQGIADMAKDLGVLDEVLATAREARITGMPEDRAAEVAVREMLAHAEELRVSEGTLNRAKRFYKEMLGAVREALRRSGLAELSTVSDADMLRLLKNARSEFESGRLGAYPKSGAAIVFRSPKAAYAPAYAAAGEVADRIVAENKTLGDKIKENVIGLGFRTKYLDRYAPLQKIADNAQGREQDAQQATNMMYFTRMYDQRNQFVAEVVANGPLKVVTPKDGKGKVIESQEGASIKKVVEALGKTDFGGNAEARNKLFSLYLAARRAERVGFDTLNFDLSDADVAVAQQLLKDAPKEFKEAAKLYAEYNKGLIDFAVQSGALSKELGAELTAHDDYVPFYREERGEILMKLDAGQEITIGNLKNQPYLKELVGGNNKILPFLESSLQNTSMLTDMALRNLATRNTAYALHQLGLGKFVPVGMKGADLIQFKMDGEEKAFKVDSEAAGINPEMLVKGMEGVATSIPDVVRLMGAPASLLRKFVTRNPIYVARQLVRDSLATSLAAGADFKPIVASVKEFSKSIRGVQDKTLEKRGIVGGTVFSHDMFDNKRLLQEMSSGKPGWASLLAKADALSIQADASTRRAAYNSYIKQGLTEQEATLATLEAMNFSRHGTSSSVRMLGTMIPFLNAQIQSLDALYRAFTGKMPNEQKLNIKSKLMRRGLMLAAVSMMYAAGMEDDEAYQNASLEDRYNNWFVRVPGIDDPVKIPIPFELGYIFKAIPEAIVNTMSGSESAEDAAKAVAALMWTSVPNFFVPQGLKPAMEVYLNKSFYNNAAIETTKDEKVDKSERYGTNTSEVAKALSFDFEALGSPVGLSPKQIEYLVRGYTGGVGTALMKAADIFLPSPEAQAPSKIASELPVIGTAFQPVDANGKLNLLYKELDMLVKKKATLDKFVAEGDMEKAVKYAEENMDALQLAGSADGIRKVLSSLRNQEATIRRDKDMSPADKREAITELRKRQAEFVRDARGALR